MFTFRNRTVLGFIGVLSVSQLCAEDVRIWKFSEVQKNQSILASIHLKGSRVDFAQIQMSCTNNKECGYFKRIQDCFNFSKNIPHSTGNHSISFSGKTFEYIVQTSNRGFSKIEGSFVISRLGPKSIEAKVMYPTVKSWIETESNLGADERDPFTPDVHPWMNAWRKWINPNLLTFGGVNFETIEQVHVEEADGIKKSCNTFIE